MDSTQSDPFLGRRDTRVCALNEAQQASSTQRAPASRQAGRSPHLIWAHEKIAKKATAGCDMWGRLDRNVKPSITKDTAACHAFVRMHAFMQMQQPSTACISSCRAVCGESQRAERDCTNDLAHPMLYDAANTAHGTDHPQTPYSELRDSRVLDMT